MSIMLYLCLMVICVLLGCACIRYAEFLGQCEAAIIEEFNDKPQPTEEEMENPFNCDR
jgi:hypothetical protein